MNEFTQSLKPVTKFLWRFHVMIYVITVVGGVAFAIFMLSTLLNTSEITPQTGQTGFDEATITAIEAFQPADTQNTFSLPAGRVNPFVE